MMIYFIQEEATKLVKIGTTRNLRNRVSHLRLRYGDVSILGVLEGSYEKERELHERFSRFNSGRWGREWFYPSSELMEFIHRLPPDSSIFKIRCRARKKPQYMMMTVCVSRIVKIAVTLYGGEVQQDTGKGLSWGDALLSLLEEKRPDLVDRAEQLLKEQSA